MSLAPPPCSGTSFSDLPNFLRPYHQKHVDSTASPVQCGWGPYVNNGGTVLGVSGKDYAVIAADTRLSIGYSIHTRHFSKITQLTPKCVIASSGMQAEMVTLHRLLKIRIELYEHAHRRAPSVCAIAQMLSTVLYQKRFFPFYAFNLIAGVDEHGAGAVYGYDAIGSYERIPYCSTGTGGSLMMSILDNQIGKTNQTKPGAEFSQSGVIDLVKDVITSATERDIFTGDSADIVVMDGSGITFTKLELRRD
eukprot:GHVS01019635.1.p1 GENE.GHVS01019635.1~~GHVS01019635.1.p1  ORF type:complete len:250 (-),score=24.32 GHVS01019635.1:242-991(-)